MAAELGMKLIPAHKVREMGLPALIETAIERVGDKPCFLTFDIDFIDPAYAPGTGTPEVGGFTSLEGLELVRALKDLNENQNEQELQDHIFSLLPGVLQV